MIILAPTGRGKTNIAKRISGQIIKFYSKDYNRKTVIFDLKGADWQAIDKPNTKAKNLLPGEYPFGIKNCKIYIPRFMRKLEKKAIHFSFGPLEFNFKDWCQFAELAGAPAWVLKRLKQVKPEVFKSSETLINEINNIPTNDAQKNFSEYSFFIDGRTKNKLIRQLETLFEDNVLKEDNDFDVVSDLKRGIIPVFLFSKDMSPNYSRFYIGKILEKIYTYREEEFRKLKDRSITKEELGKINIIIEELIVIFSKQMKTEDNPCAWNIAGCLRQGRTFGISFEGITQSISEMHNAIKESWNYMIVGPHVSSDDIAMLKSMKIPEYMIVEIERLRFKPKENIREFMLIYEDRMRYTVFNSAQCQIGEASE